MKKITRTLICFIASILLFLINTAAYAAATPENTQSKGTAPIVSENIILGVGSNESERRIAFFSDSADRSEVRVTKADNVISGMIIKDYTTFYASTIPATNASGKYAKAATITGLLENTRYAYVIATAGYESDVYYFNTSGFGDYEFTFVGDPQLSAPSHGEEWSDTLKKIIENFDSELIISAGDQVSDPESELHYSYLTAEEMSSIAFAPSVGPSHDSSSASFKEHYNLPNLSTKYGANSTSANYWYTYNNTLFMHLNMSDSSAATNGEHKSFMKEAMAQNPDVIWNIVVMHNSLFSTGMHGDPDYKYYESEVGKYRPALAPVFSELGIDLVLSGHDHVYLRTYMMDGENKSNDEVINGTVKDPNGVLYLCASSSTGSKFYDKYFDAYFTAYENYEKRKSAVKFNVTDESITLTSYFLDDMSIFDEFTVYKTKHVCKLQLIEQTPATCIEMGKKAYYSCECGRFYSDEGGINRITDIESWGNLSYAKHDWVDATCNFPKSCSVCLRTTGKPAGHVYDDEYDAECNVCEDVRDAPTPPDNKTNGETDGESHKSLGIINSKISIIISIGALILAASVTIVFSLFKKKKRK